MPTTPKTVVRSRVDHGIGIVIRSKKVPNRLFHSLLLCVEAKFHDGLYNALTQLVVYLACLCQSRVNGGRSNTSVHGVATDGLSYTFITITHEGVLKRSRQFNLMDGDLSIVLGCLQHILKMAMSMSLNLTPEAYGDNSIDLDDTPYLHYDNEQ
jgi:hypothetical protein